jgi:2-(1,2-epoxy-1,2-dihydrophenyl)acetyl-CoA isomerase
MQNAVKYEVEEGIATITFNQPDKMNSLSREMVEGFSSSLMKIKKDPRIRAVVLTGSGKAFCAGGNIKGFPTEGSPILVREIMKNDFPFLLDLVHLEKPVIAAVNGYAVGAGFSIALACDFIFASEDSTFSMSFNKVGLVPDLGGLYHLPRIVGMARAKELALTGRIISGKEAMDYGIVLEVLPKKELIQRAKSFASTLANCATQAIGLTKYMLNRSFESSLEQFLREESMTQAIAFSSNDFKEGIKSFIDKRNPNFSGT